MTAYHLAKAKHRHLCGHLSSYVGGVMAAAAPRRSQHLNKYQLTSDGNVAAS